MQSDVQRVENINFNVPKSSLTEITSNPVIAEVVNGSSGKSTYRKFMAENNLSRLVVDGNLTDQFKAGTLQQKVVSKLIDPNTFIHEAILENNPEVIRFLLEHGVDVDYPDKNSMSPLTIAILNRCDYAISVLLEYRANTNPDVKWNGMSLMGIALNMKDANTAYLLFNHGARSTTNDFSKICSLACSSPSDKEKKGWLLFAESIIKRDKIDVNSFIGQFPLFVAIKHACERGDRSLLQLLLENGADINDKRLQNNTPLHVAIAYGKLDLVKFLIEHGADVNRKHGNHSPLERALDRNYPEIVQYLLQHGARS